MIARSSVSNGLRDQVLADWDLLADEVDAPPFLRPGWVLAWWEAFGRGGLEVATVRRSGRLVAALPVRRAGGALALATNWHTPRAGVLAADPDAAAELVDRLLRGRPRRLDLSFLDPEDPGVAALEAMAANRGYRPHRRTLLRSPYLPIRGDWSSYLATLPAKARAETARRRRRLEARGELVVDVRDGTEGLDRLLDSGFAVEGSGWKARAGSAIASRPETDRLYRRVARWAADRGWLRLGFLRLDGRPIAFDLALECDGIHHLVKTGYDPALRAMAPATVLRHAMLARAFDEGLRGYDFLGMDDPWKLVFTDVVRERISLVAYAPGPAGSLERAVRVHGRAAGRAVRRAARRLARR